VSVTACRWTVITNASNDPACKKCVAKCATHFLLIGGKYRPLPRKEVALVQAIPSFPPRGSVHSRTEKELRTPFGWVLTDAALQRSR
jgi:hypothetical protein